MLLQQSCRKRTGFRYSLFHKLNLNNTKGIVEFLQKMML